MDASAQSWWPLGAQQQVFAAARAGGFKVMLSGQGPDEYLAGYPHHIGLRAMAEVRAGHMIKAARLVMRAEHRAPLTRKHIAESVLRNALSGLRRRMGL